MGCSTISVKHAKEFKGVVSNFSNQPIAVQFEDGKQVVVEPKTDRVLLLPLGKSHVKFLFGSELQYNFVSEFDMTCQSPTIPMNFQNGKAVKMFWRHRYY